MTRPHETLGLHVPIARRLPSGLAAWNTILLALLAVTCVSYVILVNTSATKGYALRDLQRKVDALKSDTLQLEDTVAMRSSLGALSERASALGLVPFDKVEYIQISHPSYALAN